MPQVTCCLKDRSLVVRRNTLILLIRLLQEDYLKLKGTFFFRLIQCLMDPEVGAVGGGRGGVGRHILCRSKSLDIVLLY